ncbi:hypothetical protein TNCV_4447431 [Trichonephila clavipes]|nr:hypothetical protein TNCV_4447431 [Trichonephila clavipes]
MKDVTLKFVKREGIILKGDIFQIPPRRKSGIDKSREHGGQSPLEMTRSSKNSIKTSILSRDTDGFFIGLLCKVVCTSAAFVWTIYPNASCLQPILCHRTVALNVLPLMHLVLFHLDISAETNLSQRKKRQDDNASKNRLEDLRALASKRWNRVGGVKLQSPCQRQLLLRSQRKRKKENEKTPLFFPLGCFENGK